MLRKHLLVALAVALMAAVAPAGEIRVQSWPTQYVPVEITRIKVVMDVGYWVDIVNQNDVIKLQQVSIRTYQGCLDLNVKCNFSLRLSSSIAPTGAIGGKYSSSFKGADIYPPGGIATLCAELKDAQLEGKPGGSRNVHVATVTVRIVPRS